MDSESENAQRASLREGLSIFFVGCWPESHHDESFNEIRYSKSCSYYGGDHKSKHRGSYPAGMASAIQNLGAASEILNSSATDSESCAPSYRSVGRPASGGSEGYGRREGVGGSARSTIRASPAKSKAVSGSPSFCSNSARRVPSSMTGSSDLCAVEGRMTKSPSSDARAASTHSPVINPATTISGPK